jgi:hypothetical protein
VGTEDGSIKQRTVSKRQNKQAPGQTADCPGIYKAVAIGNAKGIERRAMP